MTPMPVTAHARRTVACVLATVLLAACNNGSLHSQRSSAVPTQATTVQNASITAVFAPPSCEKRVGSLAQLRFTITNHRSGESERLISIRMDAAKRIALPGAATEDIPPGGILRACQPTLELSAGSPRSVAAATIPGLNAAVRPGAAVPVTFVFRQFGELTQQVPVEPCSHAA
jgi:copper(I)-binding protein